MFIINGYDDQIHSHFVFLTGDSRSRCKLIASMNFLSYLSGSSETSTKQADSANDAIYNSFLAKLIAESEDAGGPFLYSEKGSMQEVQLFSPSIFLSVSLSFVPAPSPLAHRNSDHILITNLQLYSVSSRSWRWCSALSSARQVWPRTRSCSPPGANSWSAKWEFFSEADFTRIFEHPC